MLLRGFFEPILVTRRDMNSLSAVRSMSRLALKITMATVTKGIVWRSNPTGAVMSFEDYIFTKAFTTHCGHLENGTIPDL